MIHKQIEMLLCGPTEIPFVAGVDPAIFVTSFHQNKVFHET